MLPFLIPIRTSHFLLRLPRTQLFSVNHCHHHQKVRGLLDVFPIITNRDGVYFNGGHLPVFLGSVSWCACTTAHLQEAFALHFGCSTTGLVFRGGMALHGWKKLPLADTIRFGNLVERFSGPNRNANNVLWRLCHMTTWIVEVKAERVLIGRVLPMETLGSQDILECLLELLTWTWVDDGVNAAVQVSKPKCNFKNRVWGLASRKEGTWNGKNIWSITWRYRNHFRWAMVKDKQEKYKISTKICF